MPRDAFFDLPTGSGMDIGCNIEHVHARLQQAFEMWYSEDPQPYKVQPYKGVLEFLVFKQPSVAGAGVIEANVRDLPSVLMRCAMRMVGRLRSHTVELRAIGHVTPHLARRLATQVELSGTLATAPQGYSAADAQPLPPTSYTTSAAYPLESNTPASWTACSMAGGGQRIGYYGAAPEKGPPHLMATVCMLLTRRG